MLGLPISGGMAGRATRNSWRVFPPWMDPPLILMALLGLLFAALATWLYFANRKR